MPSRPPSRQAFALADLIVDQALPELEPGMKKPFRALLLAAGLGPTNATDGQSPCTRPKCLVSAGRATAGALAQNS